MKFDSLFDVIGHIMVGPSSSHTAGACKIGLITRKIFGTKPEEAIVYLHGSFAETYKGHGTDKAIIAGILGISPDDENLKQSFHIAQEKDLNVKFIIKDLGSDYHPNSTLIELRNKDEVIKVLGSSIGGGNIIIEEINGLKAGFNADLSTLICMNKDQIGVVADITRVVAEFGLNIANMSVSRDIKTKSALCWLETNQDIPEGITEQLAANPKIKEVRILNV